MYAQTMSLAQQTSLHYSTGMTFLQAVHLQLPEFPNQTLKSISQGQADTLQC
jgi:hypothetical protein